MSTNSERKTRKHGAAKEHTACKTSVQFQKVPLQRYLTGVDKGHFIAMTKIPFGGLGTRLKNRIPSPLRETVAHARFWFAFYAFLADV